MTSYESLMREVVDNGGVELERLMDYPRCEYDGDFLGFLNVYDAARSVAPKCMTIVDLGCYMAAQAVLFRDYSRYIGIDSCDVPMMRQGNAEYHVATIQDYLDTLDDTSGMFAICSYVPDEEARRLVREKFDDCLVYYPSAVI